MVTIKEKWKAGSGAGLTWTNAFSVGTYNGLGAGQAVLSDIQIDNSTTLDMFADLSVQLGSTTTAGGFDNIMPPQFYIYPLNSDGVTYGDGRFATHAAGPPPIQYFVGSISITNGATNKFGMIRQIPLPPAKFKFVIFVPPIKYGLPSSSNSIQYRTYNRSGV